MKIALVILILGTLSVKAQYYNAPPVMSSVAAMTNRAPPSSINPYLILGGYTTNGDNRGGLIFYDKLATNDVDDSIYFAPSIGGGRFIRADQYVLINGQFYRPLYITNNSAVTGGILLVTNGNGELVLVATNLPAGGSGATNGTAVYVDSTFTLDLNLIDSAEIDPNLVGTNGLFSLIDGSISTNRIDSNFHDLLISGGGTGAVVRVNAGPSIPDASFDTTSYISFSEVGGSITAGIVNASIGTNKLDTQVYNLLIAGGSTGSVVRVNGGANIPIASFDTTTYISFAESGGSITASIVNASISTNLINTTFYNLLVGGGGTGTVVSVNGGGALPIASFDTSSFIGFGESGGSVTATVVNSSIGTNKLDSQTYNLLIAGGGGSGTNLFLNDVLLQPAKLTNSASLTGGLVWNTNAAGDFFGYATNIAAGATDLESLTDVDLGTPSSGQVLSYNGTTWTNAAPTGGATNDTWGVYVGGSPVTNANAISSVNATVSVSSVSNFTYTFTGVGSATNGYLLKSVTTTTNTGGDGLLSHMNVTIPGNTLSEDGDELIFTIPGTWISYPGHVAEHFTWAFIWDDDSITLASNNGTNSVTETSSTRAVLWEVRLKRLSLTNFMAWTVWQLGHGSGDDFIESPMDTLRVSQYVEMSAADFSQGLTFLLNVEHDATSGASEILKTFGYTVVKVGSVGGGGLSTRTGIPRYLMMDASYFQPESTEPATAVTNSWSTTTDRSGGACWSFSATSTNGVRAGFIFPPEWDSGTLNVKLYWKQGSGAEANTTNVWQAAIGSLTDDDTGGNTLGTAVTVLDQGLNDTNKLAITSWSTAITPGNTPAPMDAGLLSIRRLPGHSSDNMTVTAFLLGVLMEYTESETEPTDN